MTTYKELACSAVWDLDVQIRADQPINAQSTADRLIKILKEWEKGERAK